MPQETKFHSSFFQGILNEVWKNKLIFVETPDANETSIALENYRRVRHAHVTKKFNYSQNYCRLAIMAEELFFCRSRVAKCQRVLISITTMGEL
jgi:hypothetical protein